MSIDTGYHVENDYPRIIVALEISEFYTQIEELKNQDLKLIPLCVKQIGKKEYFARNWTAMLNNAPEQGLVEKFKELPNSTILLANPKLSRSVSLDFFNCIIFFLEKLANHLTEQFFKKSHDSFQKPLEPAFVLEQQSQQLIFIDLSNIIVTMMNVLQLNETKQDIKDIEWKGFVFCHPSDSFEVQSSSITSPSGFVPVSKLQKISQSYYRKASSSKNDEELLINHLMKYLSFETSDSFLSSSLIRDNKHLLLASIIIKSLLSILSHQEPLLQDLNKLCSLNSDIIPTRLLGYPLRCNCGIASNKLLAMVALEESKHRMEEKVRLNNNLIQEFVEYEISSIPHSSISAKEAMRNVPLSVLGWFEPSLKEIIVSAKPGIENCEVLLGKTNDDLCDLFSVYVIPRKGTLLRNLALGIDFSAILPHYVASSSSLSANSSNSDSSDSAHFGSNVDSPQSSIPATSQSPTSNQTQLPSFWSQATTQQNQIEANSSSRYSSSAFSIVHSFKDNLTVQKSTQGNIQPFLSNRHELLTELSSQAEEAVELIRREHSLFQRMPQFVSVKMMIRGWWQTLRGTWRLSDPSLFWSHLSLTTWFDTKKDLNKEVSGDKDIISEKDEHSSAKNDPFVKSFGQLLKDSHLDEYEIEKKENKDTQKKYDTTTPKTNLPTTSCSSNPFSLEAPLSKTQAKPQSSFSSFSSLPSFQSKQSHSLNEGALPYPPLYPAVLLYNQALRHIDSFFSKLPPEQSKFPVIHISFILDSFVPCNSKSKLSPRPTLFMSENSALNAKSSDINFFLPGTFSQILKKASTQNLSKPIILSSSSVQEQSSKVVHKIPSWKCTRGNCCFALPPIVITNRSESFQSNLRPLLLTYKELSAAVSEAVYRRANEIQTHRDSHLADDLSRQERLRQIAFHVKEPQITETINSFIQT